MVMGIRKKRGKEKEAGKAGGEGREGEREAFNFQGSRVVKGVGAMLRQGTGKKGV